jgi:hypothetical protein
MLCPRLCLFCSQQCALPDDALCRSCAIVQGHFLSPRANPIRNCFIAVWTMG